LDEKIIMSDINQLVLESINNGVVSDHETPEGKTKLDNMHILPKGEWEIYTQKPGNLFDRDGNRI